MSFNNNKPKKRSGDRFDEMYKQQELIEKKKQEIQAKVDEKKRKETEDALKKLGHNMNSKPLLNTRKNMHSRFMSYKNIKVQEEPTKPVLPGNIFSNDGSFLQQFHKLAGIKAPKIRKSNNDDDEEGNHSDKTKESDTKSNITSEDNEFTVETEKEYDEKKDEEKPAGELIGPLPESSVQFQQMTQVSVSMITVPSLVLSTSQTLIPIPSVIIHTSHTPSIPPPQPLHPQNIPPPSPLQPHAIPPPTPLQPYTIPPPSPLQPHAIPTPPGLPNTSVPPPSSLPNLSVAPPLPNFLHHVPPPTSLASSLPPSPHVPPPISMVPPPTSSAPPPPIGMVPPPPLPHNLSSLPPPPISSAPHPPPMCIPPPTLTYAHSSLLPPVPAPIQSQQSKYAYPPPSLNIQGE
ncbi:hypothetical protein WDU94_010444 [Cyamophila willieti]